MSPLFQLVLVVFLLISNNGGGAVYGYSAFMIRLKAQDQACFYENLNSNERTDLSFQVAEGGNLDIDFWVTGPDNRNLYTVHRETTTSFGFNAQEKGKYEYCFSNKMSSVTDKLVSFTLSGPDENAKMRERMMKVDPNHPELEKELAQLGEGLMAMKDEAAYLMSRSVRHRQTAESTKHRIFWWSLIETVFLIGICGFQITYLRRFFEVKRSI